ncbi:MAG: glycosyltransferase [Desulfomonilaceae bacterium]
MKRCPPVAIGLPVYNGEKYLAESIESVLAQDFGDFDFLISDNCSTDFTWDLCNNYADKDKRIRLNRNEKNLGAIPNFQLVLNRTKSKYFMWHAHDDILGQTYLRKCYEVMETRIDCSVCCARVTYINEVGDPICSSIAEEEYIENEATDRFRNHWENMGVCDSIYGLIRRTAVESIGDIPRTVIAPDIVLIFELLLTGKFCRIDEMLRFRRTPSTPDSNIKQLINQGPKALLGKKLFIGLIPYTRWYLTFLSRIRRSSIVSEDNKRELLNIMRSKFPLTRAIKKDYHYYRVFVLSYLPRIHLGPIRI